MTRKDYELIAKAIKATADRLEETKVQGDLARTNHAKAGVRKTAAHLADALAADNPAFDAGRFLTACGYGATTMNPSDPALDLRPLS